MQLFKTGRPASLSSKIIVICALLIHEPPALQCLCVCVSHVFMCRVSLSLSLCSFLYFFVFQEHFQCHIFTSMFKSSVYSQSVHHSSFLAGLLDYTRCPLRIAVFAGPYVGVHLRTSLTSSALLLQQCLACLRSFLWWAAGGHTATVFRSAASRICIKQQQAFSLSISR